MFSNFTLENDFHINKTPIPQIGKIKKNAGVNEVASPIAPCAKNHEIKNATKPLNSTFPLTSIDFILNTPCLLFIPFHPSQYTLPYLTFTLIELRFC